MSRPGYKPSYGPGGPKYGWSHPPSPPPPSIARTGGLFSRLFGKRCPVCKGRGKTGWFSTCDHCGGSGRIRS